MNIHAICSVVVLWAATGFANTQTLEKKYVPVPEDALQFLDGLSGKSVSLELILSRGIATSDSYASIQSESVQKEALLLEARAPLATQFELRGLLVDNENEPTNPFAPVSSSTKNFGLSLAKQLSSGTTVKADVGHGDQDIFFQNVQPSVFKETVAELSISQSLWRNSFGRQTRNALLAGRISVAQKDAQISEQTLVWMQDLTDLFYQAWLAQEQVRAARANLQRKKRLYGVTELQVRRGTAEAPDLLQVKGAQTVSEIQLRDRIEALETIWRSLVLSLQLPRHWAEIDPMEVPVVLDDPMARALSLCNEKPDAEPWIAENDAVRSVVLQKESSALLLENAKDRLRPDLSLSVGLRTNGIDTTDRGQTASEAFSAEHPEWTVGLRMNFSLERFQEKAEFRRRSGDYAKLQAESSLAKTALEANWSRDCSALTAWRAKLRRLEGNVADQKRRNDLEEKRFQLGRGTLLNVINAGDDFTNAELTLNAGMVESRQAAWRVLRWAGESKTYLRHLMTTVQKDRRAYE